MCGERVQDDPPAGIHAASALPFGPGSSASAAALRSTVPSLVLTSVLCLGFALCASIPVLPLQYATFTLQVINRSFLYGGNAAFLTLAYVGGLGMRHVTGAPLGQREACWGQRNQEVRTRGGQRRHTASGSRCRGGGGWWEG